MIKFKGTTLYPPAIFDLLNEMDDILDYIVDVSSNEIGLDEVLLHLLPLSYSDACDRRIRANLQARLRVSPAIEYVDADRIQKMQSAETGRKAIKFIDRRK